MPADVTAMYRVVSPAVAASASTPVAREVACVIAVPAVASEAMAATVSLMSVEEMTPEWHSAQVVSDPV